MDDTPTTETLLARIAELEATLAKVENHNRRLEAVIDNAPGIMFESEGTLGQASYRIPYVNRRVEQILGYTRDEWMQKPTLWCEIVHADDKDKVFPKASQFNAQGGDPAENRFIAKDGRVVWVEPHIRVIKGPSGETIGRSVFMIDVTERRKAQEARDELRRRIDNVIASTPGAVWEASGGGATGLGQLTFMSPFITAMIGYQPDEIVGNPEIWAHITHPEDADRVASEIEEIGNNGGGRLQNRWITRDGRVIWVESHIRVTSSEGGAPAGACGVTMDITEQKLAEQAQALHNDAVIKAQAAALAELGAPLIPISAEVLVMPLIGALDPQRSQRVMDALLQGIGRTRARVAIIDITGVPHVDAHTADALMRAALAVRLLGAEVVLTGTRPEVARTLVNLGSALQGIVTRGTLESGIAYATRTPMAYSP